MENPFIDQDQNPNVSPMPTALRYGLIGGVLYIIVFLLLYLLDLYRDPGLSVVISIALLATVIFLAQKAHRDNDLGGYLTFGRGVGVGMLTVLFAAIISSIFFFVFLKFIDSSLLEEAVRKAEDKILEGGRSDVEIEQEIRFAKIFITPFIYAITSFFGFGIYGITVSLITSGINKKG